MRGPITFEKIPLGENQTTLSVTLFANMFSRFVVGAVKQSRASSVRSLTTKTSIVDHATGKTIILTDPNRPQIADYPNPEPKLAQSRDPYQKYDFQQLRRNKNDPLNIDDDLYDMWSPEYYLFVSDKTALKHNAIFFSLIFSIAGAVAYFQLNPEKPAMPRSFPDNGLAQSLGSGDEKSDYFYKVRSDLTAKNSGILPAEEDLAAQKEAYLKANPDFFKA